MCYVDLSYLQKWECPFLNLGQDTKHGIVTSIERKQDEETLDNGEAREHC